MSLVKFIKGEEADITKLETTSSVAEGALYVATDTGTMWLGNSRTSLLQIKDNIDTDTWNALKGATSNAAGSAGYVAAPAKGQQEHFLRGDATWVAISKDTVGLGNVNNTADSAKSVKHATSADAVPWTGVSGRPTSLPASDVYDWAKAASKPSYTASEVGAVPISRTVNGKALSTDITLSASDVDAAASSHTHLYAGSSSAGGSATSAVKLDSDSDAGTVTQPVYFSGGKPVACTAYSKAKVKEATEEHTVVQDTEDNASINNLLPNPNDTRNRIWLCVDGNGQLKSVKVYVTE